MLMADRPADHRSGTRTERLAKLWLVRLVAVGFVFLTWDDISGQQWELRHFVTAHPQILITLGWGVVVVLGLLGADRVAGLVEGVAKRILVWGQGYLNRHPVAMRWFELWRDGGRLTPREQRQASHLVGLVVGGLGWLALNYLLFVLWLAPGFGLTPQGWVVGVAVVTGVCALGGWGIARLCRFTLAIDDEF